MDTIKRLLSRIAHSFGLSRPHENLDLASRLANGQDAPSGARELFQAAADGHVSEVEDLLHGGGSGIRSVLNDALGLAARNGRTAVAAKLLEAGADVHELYEEPLRWAAEAGHTRTVEFLLAAGADPHIRDDEPLRTAIANGHVETARVLQDWAKPS